MIYQKLQRKNQNIKLVRRKSTFKVNGSYEQANSVSLIAPWLNRATALGYTLPSASVQSALTTFMNSLNSVGLWSRMKTGYIMHAGSLQMGTLNIKDPLTYVLSDVSSPIFSEGNGVKSNGISSYRNQPFKSNEYSGIESDLTGVQYISESSTTSTSQASHGFRNSSLTNYFLLNPLYTPINFRLINFNTDASGSFRGSSGNHKGLYIHRNNGTIAILWKEGVKFTFAAVPSVPVYSQNRLILCNNDNTGNSITPASFYTKYVAVDFLFDGFTDADELNFRTAFNTYKTTVGLP